VNRINLSIKTALVLIFLFFNAAIAQADIKDVTCVFVTPPPADLATKKYNNGQAITLSATWTSDSKPFAATFKANSITIGTENTSNNEAKYNHSASGLPEGSNNFSVSITETSVVGGQSSPDTSAQGALTVDRTAPSITVAVVVGAVVGPNGDVEFTVTSNEALGVAPEFSIFPGTWANPTAVYADSPYLNTRYKITVPADTAAGAYTIKATCRDNTEPADARNTSTGQAGFVVDSQADGSPTIVSCSPKSPFRTESVLLSGTVPKETAAQKIEILEGTTVLGNTSVPANTDTWTYNISPVTEGPHVYTARRTDPLGNVSASSADFSVVADRTPPANPVLNKFSRPVNTKKVRVTGNGILDPSYGSNPLKVAIYVNGKAVASITVNLDGSFAFEEVELEKEGVNIITAQSSDTTFDGTGNSGNTGGFSEAITITLDQTAPVIVSGGIVIANGVGGGSTALVSVAPPLLMKAESKSPPLNNTSVHSPAVISNPPIFTNETSLVTKDNSKRLLELNEKRNGSEKTFNGFEPPMGSSISGRTPLLIPFSVIKDRNAKGITGRLVFRRASEPSSREYSCALQIMPKGLEAFIPFDPSTIIYKFVIYDGAGNKNYFPPSGEFIRPNRRYSALRMPLTPAKTAVLREADEWPIDTLGFPPVERLLSYRSIFVHPKYLEKIREMLASAENPEAVELHPLKPNPELITGFKNDLSLLSEGKLPFERIDLLIQEIVNCDVPLSVLPDPKDISDKPYLRQLKDAIQFRLLHEKGP